MDEMKVKLANAVAAKLASAPQSADKDELIEELSDNLYRRFLDMTGAGVPEEEAFNRALDDLGDVDELLSYLGVEPETDLKITVTPDGSQAEIDVRDGQRVVINTGDDFPITVKSGDEPPVTDKTQPQDESEPAADGNAKPPFEGDVRYGYQPKGSTDARSDVHYDYHADVSPNDLDAILASVSEACNTAIDQAKAALKQAKDAMKRRTTVQRDKNHVNVHFNTHPDAPTPPETPEPPAGWEFEAELDRDQGRFFAGAGPKQQRDIIYGFGFDKAKGGFFTQWGEWKGGYRSGEEVRGPHFSGEDSGMQANDDGSYSVTALRDLRGIEVQTVAGDVVIHVSEAPDAGVIIDGDVDDLDVTCSADGVLTIREGRTASSSFFSRRGIGSADVELYLPRRHWETILVSTVSGDVEIDRDGLDIDSLSVHTSSGDLNVRLRACGQLHFQSSSGDLDLSGTCDSLHVETASGDATLQGQIKDAAIKTASGDIQMEGVADRFLARTMSGDVEVETSVLPQVMDLSSKSGDCHARIPEAGPFSLRMKTVSGEMDCELHMNYINGVFVYGDGSGPSYSMTSISGDVVLERY